MNKNALLLAGLFTLLTGTLPALAQESSATSSVAIEDVAPSSVNPKVRLTPQVGMSSMGAAESAKASWTAGVTTELGQTKARLLEVGVLVVNTSAQADFDDSGTKTSVQSTYLTLPMIAKLRVATLKGQSLYGKFGFLTAFEMSSNKDKETSNVDLIGSVGAGSRFYFNKRTDLLVEASYNRGMIDTLKGSGEGMNQGFLIMTGLSFEL